MTIVALIVGFIAGVAATLAFLAYALREAVR